MRMILGIQWSMLFDVDNAIMNSQMITFFESEKRTFCSDQKSVISIIVSGNEVQILKMLDFDDMTTIEIAREIANIFGRRGVWIEYLICSNSAKQVNRFWP